MPWAWSNDPQRTVREATAHGASERQLDESPHLHHAKQTPQSPAAAHAETFTSFTRGELPLSSSMKPQITAEFVVFRGSINKRWPKLAFAGKQWCIHETCVRQISGPPCAQQFPLSRSGNCWKLPCMNAAHFLWSQRGDTAAVQVCTCPASPASRSQPLRLNNDNTEVSPARHSEGRKGPLSWLNPKLTTESLQSLNSLSLFSWISAKTATSHLPLLWKKHVYFWVQKLQVI